MQHVRRSRAHDDAKLPVVWGLLREGGLLGEDAEEECPEGEAAWRRIVAVFEQPAPVRALSEDDLRALLLRCLDYRAEHGRWPDRVLDRDGRARRPKQRPRISANVGGSCLFCQTRGRPSPRREGG